MPLHSPVLPTCTFKIVGLILQCLEVCYSQRVLDSVLEFYVSFKSLLEVKCGQARHGLSVIYYNSLLIKINTVWYMYGLKRSFLQIIYICYSFKNGYKKSTELKELSKYLNLFKTILISLT